MLRQYLEPQRPATATGRWSSTSTPAAASGRRWRRSSAGASATLDRLRILDFASGYGRVTRHAVLDVAPERLWVADIYAAGVRFQEEQLGVHGLVSHADPDRFECAETFDAILVSSLFTHLPEATFRSWLRRLWGLLRPAAFWSSASTTRISCRPARELPPSGMLFDLKSESGSLPGEEYGTSWVDEALRPPRAAAIWRPAPPCTASLAGLVNFQDLCDRGARGGCRTSRACA